MPLRNVRKHNIATEQYDPRQRLVGGIVLFLMMLLIYGILKLLLGLSAPDKFAIDKVLEFEHFSIVSSEDVPDAPDAPNTNTQIAKKFKTIIPEKFVFLDLSGNAMRPEDAIAKPPISTDDLYSSIGEERWYVQVASFKDRSRAQDLVKQIKAKNISSEVHIIPTGSWFAVRLPPETDYNIAQKQKNQLRRSLSVKPKVNKIK